MQVAADVEGEGLEGVERDGLWRVGWSFEEMDRRTGEPAALEANWAPSPPLPPSPASLPTLDTPHESQVSVCAGDSGRGGAGARGEGGGKKASR